MSKKVLFDRHVPSKIFKPKFRTENPTSGYLKKPDNLEYDGNLLKDTNVESSASFRYGNKKSIVSTQQVRTDFSNFVNHTFFHSAVANVNEAFDRIVNFYPIDGSNKEIEEFEDSLTGFEKYILDNFPKNVGYLVFSGTQVGEAASNGTYLSVNDSEGSEYGALSKNRSAKAVLDPQTSPFTLSFFCKIPEIENDNQVILQKKQSLANNFTLALSSSASTVSGSIIFGITSGSNYSYVTGSVLKGSFVNINAIYDPEGDEKTKLVIDDNVYTSSMDVVFDALDFSAASLTIGTGEQVRINDVVFDQQQTFSGSIDDIRFFHVVKSLQDIKKERYITPYPDEHLKLYFKFNEPSGSYSAKNVALDSSKSNLHTKIINYLDNHSRVTGSDSPVKNELHERNPVLFPDYPAVESLNTTLLTSGSEYDDANPNLITKLIPPHYFLEANNEDGFTEVLGNLGTSFVDGSNKFPAKNISELQSATLLVKFLLAWAKFFDETKIIVDSVTSTNNTFYEEYDTTPDVFLKRRAEDLNIDLPKLFSSADLAQTISGINLTEDYANATLTLNKIQNIVWRRIISDSVNTKLTKGTVDSIKSIFKSTGIEPDNILTFREYGGAQLKSLESSRGYKVDVFGFMDFSGSKGTSITGIDFQGYPTNTIPKMKSGFLSGSRLQHGNPPAVKDNKATGTIEVGTVGTITDGLILNVTDSAGKSLKFEFDDDDSIDATSDVSIPIESSDSDQALQILHKITGSFSGSISGSISSDTITLTQVARPRMNLGNHLLEGTISSVDVTLSGFSGGAGFIFEDTPEYGINGISTRLSDGLFTSGSFTYEGVYKYELPPSGSQSLIRLHTTGALSPSNKESIIANLVSDPTDNNKLNLFVRDSPTASSHQHLFLTGVNIYDEDMWHISFGRKGPHDIGDTNRSIIFLRAAKQEGGEVLVQYQTSSHYITSSNSTFTSASINHNASGSFLSIGRQIFQNGSAGMFLNDTTSGTTVAHSSSFDGLVTNCLFWSKFVTEKEWLEHVKNYSSVGVIDAKKNYNYETHASGSFERLVLHTNGKQSTTASNGSGNIRFFDFTQNDLHFEGSNFENSKKIMKPYNAQFEVLSPLFDTNIAREKVRVRSYQSADMLTDSNFAQIAPVYQTVPSEEVVDDNRFSIDMSVQKGINDNIMTMFANFSSIDDALGKPNNLFSESYPELDHLRNVFFNNVLEKADLGKFRGIFKWIDNAFTDIVFSLVPRSTNFLGINFIYESHVLERNKMKYLYDEIYLKALPRDPSRGNLLLSQFVGKIKKN